MGQKSIKENKNIYQIIREEQDLTREKACKCIIGMDTPRLNRIENNSLPTPDKVYNMSKAYKRPELCSYYCANECRIGKENNKSEIEIKELSQIVLRMLDSLRTMNDTKDSLISITVDGEVDDKELEEFCKIQENLKFMQDNIECLKVWTDKMLYSGKINEEKYHKLMGMRSNLQKK